MCALWAMASRAHWHTRVESNIALSTLHAAHPRPLPAPHLMSTLPPCILRPQDPACTSYSQALLYYKGYHAIQTHRIAHALLKRGQKVRAGQGAAHAARHLVLSAFLTFLFSLSCLPFSLFLSLSSLPPASACRQSCHPTLPPPHPLHPGHGGDAAEPCERGAGGGHPPCCAHWQGHPARSWHGGGHWRDGGGGQQCVHAAGGVRVWGVSCVACHAQ